MVHTKFSSIIKCFFDVLWVGSLKTPPFVDILNLMELFCNFIDTPEQNGVAESKHRHIIDTARSLRLSAYVPSSF